MQACGVKVLPVTITANVSAVGNTRTSFKSFSF